MANHQSETHGGHGSIKEYTIGFLLSILLTIIPLVVVMNEMYSWTTRLVIILIMAVLQFLVQILFFMHIRDEKGPRFNLMALIVGVGLMLLIVIGSIWIMTYNVVGH